MTVKASTSDTLTLNMSEDAWSGDAEFIITVDGVQIGGVQTVTALNGSGQTQAFTVQGDFGAGPHTVAIQYVNPATGGTAATTRNLYLDSVSLDGTAMALDTNVTGTTSESITAAAPPAATNTLTVNVAEDAWEGNAEFVVLVDGTQVGGTQTATALHNAGQTQNITLTGDFGAGSHTVAVKFINDAYGGSTSKDRNLYVNSVTYDGTTTAVNKTLLSNGSTTPVTVSDVASVTPSAVTLEPDSLVLYVMEDAYLGDAEFSVTVNGNAVGGIMTATALHYSNQQQAFTLNGSWGNGPISVAVTFLNDANGPTGDRNLYVNSITYNGVAQADSSAALDSNGTATFTVTPQALDTLVLYVAEDAYLGDAEFSVTVNGQAVGGVMTATALHYSNQQQAFTLTGNWGTAPAAVAVTFLNDASGPTGDRNLYVNSITYDGYVQANSSAPLDSNGTAAFTVVAAALDTLVLYVAEDAYLGDAEFSVTVNGQAVGGIMTATALHSSSQQQAFTLTGNWGTGAAAVAVTFLNDASGPTGDRNLYVDAITYNADAQANGSATLDSNGTANFTVQATAAASDSLVLYMAEDAYLGDAEFSVTVDGQAEGGIMTVTALHNAGQEEAFTLPGDFGAGPVTVAVTFLNDASGANGDRNLYVDAITYHGYVQTNAAAPLDSDGTAYFSVEEPDAPPVPSVTDTLTIYVSEDYYLGNAEFSVTVDGNEIGGTQTATGINADGGTAPVTLTGVFGPGAHTVVVTFLNDATGGSSALDRNLYVSGIVYNGVYTGVDAQLYYTGASSTTVVGLPGATAPTPVAQMSTPGTFEYVGVNLSGLEFGGATYPGVLNTDYVVPTDAEIDYYKSEGMNIIRLPFDWERLQPVMNGPLNQTYLSLIDGVVDYAASKGMTVDLDVHNYGAYYGNDIGTTAVPNSAFANLWSQLATHYVSQSNVMFELMNEPQESSAQQWLGSANAAIAAIRAAGAGQEILVDGIDSSGGESWTTSDNASVMSGIVDPKMNFAFDIHQYLNGGGDAPLTQVAGPSTLGVSDLTAVTQWAEATGNRLFLGEFGSGTDATGLTAMQNMLTYMAQNTNVWQGVSEWGGGPWWGNYGFATDPVNGVTQPQINVLKSFE